MELKNFFSKLRRSKKKHVALCVAGEIIVLLLVFHAGISYGERRVFHRLGVLQNRHMPEFGFLSHSFIPQGHGMVGIITEVALPTITLQTREGNNEVVKISTSTIIRDNNTPSAPQNLIMGVHIMVLGDPENNTEQFTARFINILPTSKT